ncbi:MAG TPA: hypothetical protein VF941_03870, partial [Clostridia bacterium]
FFSKGYFPTGNGRHIYEERRMVLIKINKKYFYIIILGLLICIGTLVSSSYFSVFNKNIDVINAEIEFKVNYFIEENHNINSCTSIKNARLILIDDKSGKIITTGLTDENGVWKTNITVMKDLRFTEKNMGTITVIAVADGFNEAMHFNMPVNEHAPLVSAYSIMLYPFVSGKRNEPHFEYAHFHRFTVFEMLDYYAGLIGLERQPIVEDGDTPPWSPKIRNNVKKPNVSFN